jgi:molybdenum cofactor cytidylyltransferase
MSVGAIVLAAGLSMRMGTNKLLHEIDGEPLIRRVVRVVLDSRIDPVVVVLGHQAVETGAALAGLECVTVYNSNYRGGLSTSIHAGTNRLPQGCNGVLIVLGDMPSLSPLLIDRMTTAFETDTANAICVAVHKGRRGNPVLFARRYFPDLLNLGGDVGGRRILAENTQHVCEIEADDDAPLVDIDTPDALAAFRARTG